MATKLSPKAKRKSYLQSIENDLERNGCVFFTPENGRLDIKEDYLSVSGQITDLPSKELGEHLNAFTQQKMFMRTLVGRLEIFVEEARRKYLKKSEPYYRECSGRMSESAKERLVNAEPDVQPSYYEYEDLKKKLMLARLQVENIEDAIFLLSREVTRRNGDFNDENRNYNVGKRRY